MNKIWNFFPKLTERIWQDHAIAGMLGGHHDPEHAVRVAQMALEIADDGAVGLTAGASGLCHNADRILENTLGIGNKEVPEEQIRKLVGEQLLSENSMNDAARNAIMDAVLKHGGRNSESDSPVLIVLMDADRLVNAEPDFVIRAAQHFADLPAVDPVHLDKDPTATYLEPKSALRNVMETIVCLTPSDNNPFYVRTPRAREIAARRKLFFEYFLATLIACREETGFYPYPPELLALRDRYITSMA